ncbi:MAG: hypothetical protein ACTSWC_04085 [Promethearchaeota archaeon]
MWIELFEWMVVGSFVIALVGLIICKKWIIISELFAGAIFGVMLEYINIALFQGYTYHADFLLQLGKPPNNVPVAIGMAWGLLGISTLNISERWQTFPIIQILFAVIIAVSYDLLLDVVVTRLEGGFWIWAGFPLEWTITSKALYGVPWGNFIGWFFVMFYFGFFRKIGRKLLSKPNWWKNILRMLIIPIASNVSLLITLLLLGIIGAMPYGSIIFGILYGGSILLVLGFIIFKHPEIEKVKFSYTIFFWIGNYLYLIIVTILEHFWANIQLYLIICVLFFVLTLFVDIFSIKFKRNPN